MLFIASNKSSFTAYCSWIDHDRLWPVSKQYKAEIGKVTFNPMALTNDLILAMNSVSELQKEPKCCIWRIQNENKCELNKSMHLVFEDCKLVREFVERRKIQLLVNWGRTYSIKKSELAIYRSVWYESF